MVPLGPGVHEALALRDEVVELASVLLQLAEGLGGADGLQLHLNVAKRLLERVKNLTAEVGEVAPVAFGQVVRDGTPVKGEHLVTGSVSVNRD